MEHLTGLVLRQEGCRLHEGSRLNLAAPPRILASQGERATTRFVEFFTANIRNPNTRRAYIRNALAFLHWCEQHGIQDLKEIRPVTVAGYIESLGKTHAKPTVKQHLATIRMLFDWLVIGQVVPTNPAHAVRGPKHVVTRGKTPVLSAEETRQLFDSIGGSGVVDLRDRALLAAMFFTFARVGAVVAMAVEDYYPQGKRMWLRLQEKGGKQHEMPAHHKLEEFLDAYVLAAGLETDRRGPLFRSATRSGDALTASPMRPADVWRMIRRRADKAGIRTAIGCHSFRATGITNYLEHAGTLEKAQQMAAHSSPRTTKLYDRTNDQVTLDEVEKIRI
ncbi:tyrosine-type recombinase/integrase [Tautonia sp. JC769]|uniref:tyrosine-type recombinase/integrase n=2 Tax=Planctomycetia TaxID=203683 RepID=UPI003458B22A